MDERDRKEGIEMSRELRKFGSQKPRHVVVKPCKVANRKRTVSRAEARERAAERAQEARTRVADRAQAAGTKAAKAGAKIAKGAAVTGGTVAVAGSKAAKAGVEVAKQVANNKHVRHAAKLVAGKATDKVIDKVIKLLLK